MKCSAEKVSGDAHTEGQLKNIMLSAPNGSGDIKSRKTSPTFAIHCIKISHRKDRGVVSLLTADAKHLRRSYISELGLNSF